MEYSYFNFTSGVSLAKLVAVVEDGRHVGVEFCAHVFLSLSARKNVCVVRVGAQCHKTRRLANQPAKTFIKLRKRKGRGLAAGGRRRVCAKSV